MAEDKEYRIEDAEENSDNREFMLSAIKNDSPWVIRYASDKLLADKELMLEAVNQDGQELYYANQALRDDKDVVLAAVTKKWLVLKFASFRLRGDKDVALAALNQNLDAKEFLTEKALSYSEVQDLLNPKEENEE